MKDGYIEASIINVLHRSPCFSSCQNKSLYNQANQHSTTHRTTPLQYKRLRRDLVYYQQHNANHNNPENLAIICHGFTEQECALVDERQQNPALHHLRATCCQYLTDQKHRQHMNSRCVCIERKHISAGSAGSPLTRYGCACDLKVSHHANKQCVCSLTDALINQKCQRSSEQSDNRHSDAKILKCSLSSSDSFCNCQVSPKLESSASSENLFCTRHMQPLIKVQEHDGLSCSCNKSMVDGKETLVCF